MNQVNMNAFGRYLKIGSFDFTAAMPRGPYAKHSEAVRNRVRLAYDDGENWQNIAMVLGVKRQTAENWVQMWRISEVAFMFEHIPTALKTRVDFLHFCSTSAPLE